MRSGRRALKIVALVLAGGSVFAGPGTGCISFGTETLLTTADFCFIFDCQNGIFGGTISPCARPPEVVDANTGETLSDVQGPLFADCPPEAFGP
jgi:hypothetical protein